MPASRHLGVVFAHPTFVPLTGASGGGAAGGRSGAVNYVHHVLASEGAVGGLLAIVKELTHLYVVVVLLREGVALSLIHI